MAKERIDIISEKFSSLRNYKGKQSTSVNQNSHRLLFFKIIKLFALTFLIFFSQKQDIQRRQILLLSCVIISEVIE